MFGDLECRAVGAATTTAVACGLDCHEAAVVYSGSNIVVHLRPAPVVARVMTGTVAIHDDPQTWLTRELSVLAFLAPSGLAVLPSRLIHPGPHLRDGLWMTFAEWVPDTEPAPEWTDRVSLDTARAFGHRLRELHHELRPFSGELAGLGDLYDDIERLRTQLRAGTAEERERIASLGERLAALRAGVLELDLELQPLHGDVSLRNLLSTPRGLIWNDFEDTFRGPVHWDLASAVGSLQGRGGDTRSIEAMLGAYGPMLESELTPFLETQDVYDQIWRMYDRQRRRP